MTINNISRVVSLLKQEVLTVPDYRRSPLILVGFVPAHTFVFCAMLCRPIFVFPLFLLYCLSFWLRVLVTPFCIVKLFWALTNHIFIMFNRIVKIWVLPFVLDLFAIYANKRGQDTHFYFYRLPRKPSLKWVSFSFNLSRNSIPNGYSNIGYFLMNPLQQYYLCHYKLFFYDRIDT